MNKSICEMFAGVGGFRLGMERLGSGWETVWFSQWEPGAKNQYAHDCYVRHFGDVPDSTGEMCTGWDIILVNKENIPDHTLLVGGFPCQDYSVAKPLSSSKGIEGKEGVLWWQIRDSCASLLIEMGWDVKKVQNWLGHTDAKTTLNIYAQYNKQRLNESADDLAYVTQACDNIW